MQGNEARRNQNVPLRPKPTANSGVRFQLSIDEVGDDRRFGQRAVLSNRETRRFPKSSLKTPNRIDFELKTVHVVREDQIEARRIMLIHVGNRTTSNIVNGDKMKGSMALLCRKESRRMSL